MPTLDDELRERLRRAAPLPGGADDLGERIAHRRRRRAAQRTVSRVALVAAVLVGTIAGVAVLDRAFRGGSPAVSQPPVPNPTLGEDGTMALLGVPFRVCHPMSIPGSFGPGLDTLWVFEEEPRPGTGCDARGRAHVAVGDATSVAATSGPLDEQLEGLLDGASPWPYAAADIDGDGIDEIALGIGGSRTEGYARIVLFAIGPSGPADAEPGQIHRVVFDAGPAGDPVPWIGLGTFVESLSGAYCDTSSETGQPALIRWSAGEGLVEGTAWYVEGDTLRVGEQVFSRTDDGTYPPDGTTDLCGSPVSWPEDFPTYPTSSPVESTSPTHEGRDIGLTFNLCSADPLGGIDFLGDGTAGRAWVGIPEKENGTCPASSGIDRYVVAADHTGDGVADTSIPLDVECFVDCWAFDATDLDGNGSDELIVTSAFSIMDYYFFSLRPDEGGDLRLAPIRVAAPGHEAAGIAAGEPLRIDAGGDEGYASSIQCESYPEAPVIVWGWSWVPVDEQAPGEEHVTRLQLQEDGLFHAIGVYDHGIPVGQRSSLAHETAPACGVDWNPAA